MEDAQPTTGPGAILVGGRLSCCVSARLFFQKISQITHRRPVSSTGNHLSEEVICLIQC